VPQEQQRMDIIRPYPPPMIFNAYNTTGFGL
jgi:hypothetical protein